MMLARRVLLGRVLLARCCRWRPAAFSMMICVGFALRLRLGLGLGRRRRRRRRRRRADVIVEFAGDRSGNDHAFAILAHTGGMRIVARLGVRALWRFLFARRAAFANLIVQIFASAVETLEAAADSLARGHRRHRAIVTVAAARTTMRRLARVFVRAERL